MPTMRTPVLGKSGPGDQPDGPHDCARACCGLKANGTTLAASNKSRSNVPRRRCGLRFGLICVFISWICHSGSAFGSSIEAVGGVLGWGAAGASR